VAWTGSTVRQFSGTPEDCGSRPFFPEEIAQTQSNSDGRSSAKNFMSGGMKDAS